MNTQPVSVAATNTVSDTLQAQYDRARAQIDELMTERSQMDSQLSIKNAEIAKVKGKLKHEQKTNHQYAAKLKSERKLVEKLTSETRDYADRIGRLQSQNDMLVAQKDSLMHQYLALKELGSVLHASNIRLAALHLKHHGTKEKRTVKARKANILRINFDIDENRVAENGIKKIYLVITGPDGQLLSDNVMVAGMMSTPDGNNVKYSVLKEIALKKGEPVKDVTVDWKQESNYKKGIYNIAIYNGGYKIGGGSVGLI
ncbi:MAG: hypothetical protein P4L41_06360 [Flavipsychrobacter sp.]|nr:hypothetical protein [Flavipsychrobacter sp.]